MILDYAFNHSKRTLSVSYITETGGKRIQNFNVDRFKSYYSTPSGRYENWDGSRCDVRWVDKPHTFDIKTYFEEMSEQYKKLLQGKTTPKLYTFDIEAEISEEFPEPSQAKFPITTISIASPDCNVIVLGTKELEEGGTNKLQMRFEKYLRDSKFFNGLNINMPYIRYIRFSCEHDMLKYFLENIVAKVPVLAGWNSIMFDWQYIQNRIRGYYSDISLNSSSMNWMMTSKNYTDMRGEKVRLNMPNHTLILDMMDVVGSFDMVVMPIKESLSLDYIASESIGMNKIKYDGDLQKLYEEDYSTYVFYNAIDSILVQLIDKRFKTLQNIYTQALYCKEKIGSCFSKIALTEALFFNYFYEHGIKVIPHKPEDVERGTLIGAYVRTPTPGKHDLVCCNDFASLYPSSIITCNLSIENLVGTFYDEKALIPYKEDKAKYIVVGGAVYKNKGTLAQPQLGEFVSYFLLEDKLNEYRKNPNYFVSVNGSVYKNDKTYSFKDIQATLKANRNTGKYLAKQLEAMVMTDVEHVLNDTKVKPQIYPKNIVDALNDIGYHINGTLGIINLANDINALKEFATKLRAEIEYNTSFEQAMKLLGNSMYGGSSHVAFFWFNMALANDITGEARNIIHTMEKHIPEYLKNAWPSMMEFHKKHNIELDEKFVESILNSDKSFVDIVYGDTDSCAKDTIIRIEKNGVIESLTIEDLYNRYIKNDAGVTMMGHESVSCDCKILNWDKDLYFGLPKRIIRHRVTKPKWRLKTKDGKEIFVTNDHSMIVFRDGEKIEVKPKDILKTDKILIVKICDGFEFVEIESCECVGKFTDEYVYDIEMDDPSHTFIANDILVHNSLYISYEDIIKSIKDNDKLTLEKKVQIIVDLNTGFLDDHNREFMKQYYASRHVDSVQNFELETVALSGVWLDVKKRYAQILLWKDGKTYDIDNLPMKIKGLEMVKSSYPKAAREGLKRLVRYLLEDQTEGYLLQRLNMKMLEEKNVFFQAELEDICGNVGVQNYTKYILDDTDPLGLKVAPKIPYNVRALGNYNWIRNVNNLPGDPLYGGKMKWYCFYPGGKKHKKKQDPDYFAFQSRNYPKWAEQYAPVSREDMFTRTILDPFNRIVEAIGVGTLNSDGSIQMGLF